MKGESLEVTVDKFVFRVMTGCWYSEAGVWVRAEDGLGRAGVSDYLQQSSGDVAFVTVAPAGTELLRDDYLGEIETVKAAVDLLSPVSGTVRQVNEQLVTQPELVNQDPYGQGWLALIELADWEADRTALLSAEQYLAVMRSQAEEAARKL